MAEKSWLLHFPDELTDNGMGTATKKRAKILSTGICTDVNNHSDNPSYPGKMSTYWHRAAEMGKSVSEA
jgi:hypothetical protein